MRFGFWPSASNPWTEVLTVARHAERTGWDRIWFADHFMPNKPVGEDASDGLVHESWTTLAVFASHIPRIRLGHLVSGNTYRHPALTAKMAAQIDVISGGRFILGLGAAWQENEHHAYGIHFGTLRERMDRFEEACQLITEMFRYRKTTFTGRYYQLVDAPMEPRPVQTPLPLMIGGGGEKRTLRITARYANEWNVWGTPEVLIRKQSVLDAHCGDIHRDPRRDPALGLHVAGDDRRRHRAWPRSSERPPRAGRLERGRSGSTVQAYIDAGVDEIIIPDNTLGSSASQRMEQMDRFIEEIAPAFRQEVNNGPVLSTLSRPRRCSPRPCARPRIRAGHFPPAPSVQAPASAIGSSAVIRTAREYMGERAIEALRRPALEEARGLPASLYTSREFFDLEQRRLFPRTWAGIAFDTDVPAPGDAIPLTVCGLPVILVRDDERRGARPAQRLPPPRDDRARTAGPRTAYIQVPLPRVGVRHGRLAQGHTVLGRHPRLAPVSGGCSRQWPRSGTFRGVESRGVRESRWPGGAARRLSRTHGGGARSPGHSEARARTSSRLEVQGQLEAGDGELGGLPPRLGP